MRPAARISLIALAVAAAGFAALQRIEGPRIETVAATRRDVVQSVVASGRVAAPHRVEIAVQVVGTVAEVAVREGQAVRSGQRLLALDAKEGRAAERQAGATFANARAQLERSRRLHQQGFVGEAALDDAQRAYEVALTQLEAARARLAYLVVSAPAGGTLIAHDVERGDVVQPGKVLMVLSPAGETQLVLQIDERNLGRIALGQKALASADAYPERTFPAEVVYINPGVDAQRGTVEVKLRVPQPPDYLRQDMTVSVDIETARRPAALAIAAEAVRDANGPAPWVLAVRGGRAERVAVRLGLRGEGVVEVLEGLAEGERAVPAGNGRVGPGQRVRAKAG